MKGAIVLLLLACLLVYMPVVAEAHGPSNEVALDLNCIAETKITMKEEVAAAVGEIMAVLAVPIPALDASLFDVTVADAGSFEADIATLYRERSKERRWPAVAGYT